jgi:hypothetical protein
MIVYIKTHGRPGNQLTYNTLREAGYTGDIVLVIDNEDECGAGYLEFVKHDDRLWLHIFDKQKLVDEIDSGTNIPKRDVNLYAWVACERFAKQDGNDFFIMADDDITRFRYRYLEDNHLKSTPITQNLDRVFEHIQNYMECSNIAAASTGIPQMYFSKELDENLWKYRVVYQFVFRNPKFDMNWVSEYEEDIITSINMSKEGKYVTCLPMIQHDAIALGKASGGMKDMYDENNTRFRLAEYGHIFNPSCEIMNFYKGKWITNIKRNNAFQKLVSSSRKKK